MKKIFILLLLGMLAFSGCSFGTSEQKPAPLNENGSAVKTDSNIFDSAGNYLDSEDGALEISDGDVHQHVVNRHFAYYTTTNTTFSENQTQDQIKFNVTDITGFSVGEYVMIEEGNKMLVDVARILSISGNEITINKHLDNFYSTDAIVTEVIINMADVITSTASIDNPIIFRIKPRQEENWHVYRMVLTCVDNSEADDSKFCGGSVRTNGMMLRYLNNVNQTVTTWASNNDIIEDTFDVVYTDKAGGGLFGMRARWTFKKHDFVPSLNSSNGDDLLLLIHDSNTDVISLTGKIQGHVDKETILI